MPQPIVGAQRDKLVIALQMHDIVGDINTALRVRKATVTLDYAHKDRSPRLMLSMPGTGVWGWMVTSPKTRTCYRAIPAHPDLHALVNDIYLRLEKYDARLVLLADKPPNKKRICKLQVQVGGARSIVLTLAEALDGRVKHETSFQLPDGTTP